MDLHRCQYINLKGRLYFCGFCRWIYFLFCQFYFYVFVNFTCRPNCLDYFLCKENKQNRHVYLFYSYFRVYFHFPVNRRTTLNLPAHMHFTPLKQVKSVKIVFVSQKTVCFIIFVRLFKESIPAIRQKNNQKKIETYTKSNRNRR